MKRPQTLEEALAEIEQARDDLEHATTIRNRAIKSARLAGASYRALAEASGLHKDTVAKLLRQ